MRPKTEVILRCLMTVVAFVDLVGKKSNAGHICFQLCGWSVHRLRCLMKGLCVRMNEWVIDDGGWMELMERKCRASH